MGLVSVIEKEKKTGKLKGESPLNSREQQTVLTPWASTIYTHRCNEKKHVITKKKKKKKKNRQKNKQATTEK
jgi:hypothetical protein